MYIISCEHSDAFLQEVEVSNIYKAVRAHHNLEVDKVEQGSYLNSVT